MLAAFLMLEADGHSLAVLDHLSRIALAVTVGFFRGSEVLTHLRLLHYPWGSCVNVGWQTSD